MTLERAIRFDNRRLNACRYISAKRIGERLREAPVSCRERRCRPLNALMLAFSEIYIANKLLKYTFPYGCAVVLCLVSRAGAAHVAFANCEAARVRAITLVWRQRVGRCRLRGCLAAPWRRGSMHQGALLRRVGRGARRTNSVFVELERAPVVPDWSHAMRRTGSHAPDQDTGHASPGNALGERSAAIGTRERPNATSAPAE